MGGGARSAPSPPEGSRLSVYSLALALNLLGALCCGLGFGLLYAERPSAVVTIEPGKPGEILTLERATGEPIFRAQTDTDLPCATLR